MKKDTWFLAGVIMLAAEFIIINDEAFMYITTFLGVVYLVIAITMFFNEK